MTAHRIVLATLAAAAIASPATVSAAHEGFDSHLQAVAYLAVVDELGPFADSLGLAGLWDVHALQGDWLPFLDPAMVPELQADPDALWDACSAVMLQHRPGHNGFSRIFYNFPPYGMVPAVVSGGHQQFEIAFDPDYLEEAFLMAGGSMPEGIAISHDPDRQIVFTHASEDESLLLGWDPEAEAAYAFLRC